MKPNIHGKFSRYGFTRAASHHLLALFLFFFALPCLLSAQTLLHRYSFASDASDSVGAANGTVVGPNGGNAATIANGLNLPGGGGPGFSGYVTLPAGILTNTASITVECWATQASQNTWAELWNFNNGTSQYFGYIPYPANNNNNMTLAFRTGNNESDASAGVQLANNSEQYVAATFNAATLVGNLYTNGALVASVTVPNSSYTPGTYGGAAGTLNNVLGQDPYNDPQFQGTIYEFRIWNGAVSQRYLAASALEGPSVVINNLTPTSVSITAGTAVVVTGSEQATVNVTLPQTGAASLVATGDATNWVSSNPNILTVTSTGLITGVGVGSAKISATVGGVTAASANIIVSSQTLLHRYSFVSDASDSVGGANGTLVAANGGTNATIAHGLVLPGGGGGGYSGYVTLPSGLLTNTTSLTVECWVTQNQPNGWATVWDFANNNNQNFDMCPNPQRGINNLAVAVNPNNNEIDTVTGSLFPSGSKQYVSFTFNASTLVGNIYTNGLLGAIQAYPNSTYIPGSIGGAGGTAINAFGNDIYNDAQFQGTVYEFRVWNGAVSPAYIAASAVAGSSVVITNAIPTSLNVSVSNTTMIGSQTQQATASGNFLQVANVPLTGAVTNWTSSATSVLTVNSTGLITAVNGGTATVSATVNGVTAVSATITVASTAPTVPVKPVNQTVVVNDNAAFSVQALGGSLTYQWSLNSAPIAGATNSTLSLTNVNFNQAGTYSVLIANTIGSTNVSAMLTVSQPVLLHRYSFVSDASDSVGGANGTVVPPTGGTAVTINNGLSLPGGGGNNNGYVSLPSGILTNTTSITLECWVTQNAQNNWSTIWDFGNNGSQNFELCPRPDPVRNSGNMIAAFTPNNNEVDVDSPLLFPNGSEQYVTVTYNIGSLVGNIYTNATLLGSVTFPNSTYTPGTIGGAGGTTQNMLGNDVYGDSQFQGTVYEFRIWHGAVSPLYLAVSSVAGPSVVVSSLVPTAVNISVNTSMPGGQTQQASATANFTGVSGVPVTGFITNWTSSNPSVLTVNSNGVITAGNLGSATISGMLNGVTGTSALITVPASAPVITQQPTPSVTLLAGATLSATVANTGTAPFVYYWYTNIATAPIKITSSSTLTIPNVQAINAGNYTCVVSNRYGSATSSALNLTVVAPTTYQQVMVSLAPVGFWPLNEDSGTTAYDEVGGNNGTYTITSLEGSSVSLGQAGPPDSFFGNASSAQFLSAYVDIPEGPFNINGAVTILGWIQMQVASGFGNLVGHGDTSYRISIAGNNSQLGANDGLASFSTNNPYGDATAPNGINDDNWHLVAYTYTGNPTQTNNGTLYVDGVPVAGNTIVTNSVDNHLDVWIGGAPDYGTARLLTDANIANVAIFNRALTTAQIQGINTGVYVPNPSQAISISRSGSSVVLTWTSGILLQSPTLTGPWTTNSAAVSPYTVPAATGNLFFKTVQ